MGLTVLDAGLLIAVLDAGDPHHAQAREALTVARERGDELVLPASAYAECLVSPSRRGPEAVATTDQFVDALPARVEPASRAIGAAAAALRASHGRALRLPDALVVATARVLGAERIVTTDAGWPALGIVVDVISRRQVPE
jgi:predicted nucleic acid-binding protein